MQKKTVHILSVGVDENTGCLDKLGFCHLRTNSGLGAMLLLREYYPNLMLVRWELPDMPGEMLLRRIITAKPSILTIAMIQAGNPGQEVIARSIGVTAVVHDDILEKSLCEIIVQLCQSLRIKAG